MRCRSLTLCVLAILAPVCQGAQDELPAGPGRETAKKVCAGCHEMQTVVATRYTRLGWRRMIGDMMSRGAEASDAEAAEVFEYLVANFGKVNVNDAAAAEIQQGLNLSEAEAKAIVQYREQSGKYKGFEELEKTPGVSAEKLRGKRGLIAFSD